MDWLHWLPVVIAFVGLMAFTRHRETLAIFIALILLPTVVYAADTSETVAQATGDTTKVVWAWGALVSQWVTALGLGLAALVTWGLRLLPSQIYSIIVLARVDQLLQKAIQYGINQVPAYVDGKTMSVDVHNAALAKMLQYVLDNAPGWMVSWMGGPEQIVQKLIARLNIQVENNLTTTEPINVSTIVSLAKT